MDIDTIQGIQAQLFQTRVGTAVQKLAIDQIKTEGQSVVDLIASGSVNLPHQGQLLDVFV